MKQILAAILLVILLSLCFFACQKKDNNLYVVNEEHILPPNTIKPKHKTNEQYVAILHANLFQRALSANDLFDISQVIESIGDKELAHEVIISNFMNKPDVQIPSDSLMRADIDAFVYETYKRFLVRRPSESEKTWFRNYITANPNVTPELVYFSFALSHEYLFY